MKVKLIYFLLIAVLLLPVAAIAGVEGIQSDSQSDILFKLQQPADGAVLTIQQGPTEAGSTVKVQIRNNSGTVVASITADGTVIINNSTTITGTLTIK